MKDALGQVQSILVLWLFLRFHLSTATAGSVFFAAGVLAATSQLVSGWLAGRIGLINTMVWTHLPSNVLLIAAPAIVLILIFLSLNLINIGLEQAFNPRLKGTTGT